MASTRMIIAASGATLLLSTVCSTVVLAQTQQAESTATTTTSTQQADQQGEVSEKASAQTTTNQTQSTQPAPVQTAPTQAAPPPTQATPTQVVPAQTGTPPGSIAPAVAPGTVVPGTVVPGNVVPGNVVPGTTVPAPGAYVPKTQYDNTPSRFDMTQDGKRMSADDFDTWMRSRGFRVAKGKPPADCVNAPPAGVETIVGPDGCPVEISIKLDGVTFEFAKNTLRPEAKKTLDQAVEILKRHPELTVEVAGHTDSRGAADFNQKLSQTRAKTVYDYLIEKGIDAKQLEGPVGYGESKPIASNDTDAGRNQNRRTELNVKAVAALPAPAAAAGAPPVVLPATAEGVEGKTTVPATTPAPAATTPATDATDATAPAASTPAAAEPAVEDEKPATPTP